MGRRSGARVVAAVLMAMVVSVFLYWPEPALAVPSRDTAEANLLALVNQERSAYGLGKVAPAADLITVSRRHSGEMAARNEVFHNSGLASEVEGWQLLGENVGAGPTEREIHDALMASKIHRDVLLQPRFTQIGVGVVIQGGEIWLTQVFRQPEEAAAPPSTAPAPTPAPAADPAPAPAPTGAEAPPTTSTAAPSTPAAVRGEGAPISAPGTTATGGSGRFRGSTRPAASRTSGADKAVPAQDEASTAATTAPEPPAGSVPEPAAPIGDAVPALATSPLPDPADIPLAGVIAAALLLAVVAGASVTRQRLATALPA